MTPIRRSGDYHAAIDALMDRVREPLRWFPYPALIPFALALVFTAHLLPGLNPRLGSKADVLHYMAPAQPEGAIWIGIFPEGNNIVAVTADRRRFSWPMTSEGNDQLEPFIRYLQQTVADNSISSAIAGEANAIKFTAVLAVDDQLDYRHVRPVISALAAAKISQYGFETLLAQ